MSGTSADGIDVALLRSDGEGLVEPGPGVTYPYSEFFRTRILDAIFTCQSNPKLACENPQFLQELEQDITDQHCDAVLSFLEDQNIEMSDIDLARQLAENLVQAPLEGTDQIQDDEHVYSPRHKSLTA